MVTPEWLERINREFTKEHVPHVQRPMEAMRRYAIEFDWPVAFGSEVEKIITNWFRENTKQDSDKRGSFWKSIYYYDGEFWELDIGVFFGTVDLEPFKSLANMPPSILKRLESDPMHKTKFVRYWADCVDYGLSMEQIVRNGDANKFGKDMLQAAHEELSSAVFLLNTMRVNPRAIMDSRMAVEMFFKAYLGLKGLLDEKKAIKIGHDLHGSVDMVIEASAIVEFKEVRPLLSIYPEIQERYRSNKKTNVELWEAFCLAQRIGAVVVRQFSDYNLIADVERAINADKSVERVRVCHVPKI